MNILKTLYKDVFTLRDWFDHVTDKKPGPNESFNSEISHTDDSDSFLRFIDTTVVCVREGTRPLSASISQSQNSHQREIILRVVEKLMKKKVGSGQNILTLGFGYMSDDPNAYISSCTNIEYRFPNSAVNRLHFPEWKTLLSRIGDTLMTYLLENTSMYTFVPPSNYVQLTGRLAFELWPFQTGLAIKAPTASKSDRKRKRIPEPTLINQLDGESSKTLTSFNPEPKRKKLKHLLNMEELKSEAMAYAKSRTKKDMTGGLKLKKDEALSADQSSIPKRRKDSVWLKKKKKIKKALKKQKKRQSQLHDPSAEHSTQGTADYTSQDNQQITHWDQHGGMHHGCEYRAPFYQQRGPSYQERAHYQQRGPSCHQGAPQYQQRGPFYQQGAPQYQQRGPSYQQGAPQYQQRGPSYQARAPQYQQRGPSYQQGRPSYQQRAPSYQQGAPQYQQRGPSYQQGGPYHWNREPFQSQEPMSHHQGVTSYQQQAPISHSEELPSYQQTAGDQKDLEEELQGLMEDNKACGQPEANTPHGQETGKPMNWKQIRIQEKQEMRAKRKQDWDLANEASKKEKHEAKDGSYGMTESPPLSQSGSSGATHSGGHQVASSAFAAGLSAATMHPGGQQFTPSFAPGSSRIPHDQPAAGRGRGKLTKNQKKQARKNARKRRLRQGNMHQAGGQVGNVENDGEEGNGEEEGMEEGDQEGEVHTDAQQEGHIGGAPPTHAGVRNDFPNARCFPRKKMFCSRNLTERLPKDYILNRLSKEGNGAQKLYHEIFKDMVNVPGLTIENRTLLHNRVMPLLKMFLDNHKRFPYHAMLEYYCSGDHNPNIHPKYKRVMTERREQLTNQVDGSASAVWMKKGSVRIRRRHPHKIPTSQILSQHLSIREVFLFVTSALERVVPANLYGRKANKVKLFKCIRTFLSLGKYDRYTVHEVVEDMKTKAKFIPWLLNVSSAESRNQVLGHVIYWLFTEYFMVMLKSFLYITETAHHRNRLFYYRKKLWHRLHSRKMADLQKKKFFVPIAQKEAEAQLSSGEALGVASLRLLPKRKSLRPIVNLGLRPPSGIKQNIPVNKQLLNLLNVLKYHKDKDPSLVGSAIFGMGDVYPVWKQFTTRWRSQPGDQPQQLYFVKVDIATCFEGINQDKLLSIMETILEKDGEEYQVRKYITMHVAGGQVKRMFKRKAAPLSDFIPDFTKFVKEKADKENLRNSILVDQVVTQAENGVHLLQQLKYHLKNNLIKVGQKYFRQTSGISQGSILSTILCNMYYGRMERELFPLREGQELLMRVVDDFLFVTPHKDRAVHFLGRMFKGVPEYNFHVNPDKVLVNFHLEMDDIGTLPTTRTDWFPWCGMLFNTVTLHTSMDYSRYAGITIADCMTFDLSHEPMVTMRNKLLNSLKPKSYVIHMDTQLNSTEVVITNVFKLFVLSAMKFHSYNRRLPAEIGVQRNGEFFGDVVMDLANFFYNQIHPCLTKKGAFAIPRDVILWVCLHAFNTNLTNLVRDYRPFNKRLVKMKAVISARVNTQEPGLPPVLDKVCGNKVPAEFKDLIH